MTEVERTQYDVVVIGGGMAGLSAALVLGRARRSVAVVNARQPRNAAAHTAHGFLTRDHTSPLELVRLARSDVEAYDVELIEDTVVSVAESAAAELAVGLQDGRILGARQVVLATGLRDVLPDIDGAGDAWGTGLLQCPYCHGWEVRDRRLGVLGTSESSLQQAILLRQWSPDVTFFAHSLGEIPDDDARKLADRGVGLVAGEVSRLVPGTDCLSAVELAGGEMIECAALFCEPEAAIDLPLIDALGCELREDGCVQTDELGRTTVDRVWAVGNVADSAAQLITAAGDAYRTAVSLNAVLAEEDAAAG